MKRKLLILSVAIMMMLACGINAQAKKVMFLSNAEKAWTAVYVYFGDTQKAWPGEQMTKVSAQLYVADVADDCTNIVFNEGTGNSSDDCGNASEQLSVPTDDQIIYSQSEANWTNKGRQTYGENGEEVTDESAYVYYFDFSVSGGNATIDDLYYKEKPSDPINLVIPETIAGSALTVTCIGGYAFDETVSNSGYTNYHEHNCIIGTIEFPSTLVKICGHAFHNCQSLTEVVLPEGFNTLGDHAFTGCTSIKRVEFPSSLTTFELQDSQWGYAFEGAAVEEVDLSKCILLSDLGTGTFYNCNNLTKAYLPNTLDKFEAVSGKGAIFPDKTSIFVRHTTSKQVTTFTNCIEGTKLDVSNVDGLVAYAATSEDAAKQEVNMTKITSADIRRGEGLVLYTAEPGTFDIPLTQSEGTAIEENYMKGKTSSDEIANYSTVYYLSDSYFHPATDGKLAKGKAYLDGSSLSAGEAKTLNIEGVSAINSVRTSQNDGHIYNVMGQRVSNAKHGLYIVDGRKVVVK